MSGRGTSIGLFAGVQIPFVVMLAWHPAYADIVDDASAAVARLSTPLAAFEGPAQTPEYEPGKTIVYLSTDQRNPAARAWGAAIEEAATELGWNAEIIDGAGNPLDWVRGMSIAIEIGVDGIITSADLFSLRQLADAANRARIPIVGINAAALPGPERTLSLYTNIQSDPRAIGRAQADWVIADSDGMARVIIVTDCTHPLACAQSTAITNRFDECPECEILETYDQPIRDLPAWLPDAVNTWREAYDPPLYVISIADYFLDFIVPSLESAAVPNDEIILVGADGAETAYERIRAGDRYQRLTTADAYELQGWQAVDEMIRAINGSQSSFWVREPYLVTIDNVDAVGGDQNRLIPPYDFKAAYRELWRQDEEETAKTGG